MSADHRDVKDIDSVVKLRQRTEVDLAAASILSRWCQTGDTELLLKRLSILERVCLQLRAKLPANLRNSSQLLALRLKEQDQDMERKTAQAKTIEDEVQRCTHSQTKLVSLEPTP